MLGLDFSGKTAIVTGGTRGIGAAVSRILHSLGAQVMAGYTRDRASAERLESECPGLRTFAGDLGEKETAMKLVERTWEEFGGADVLVNNAGIWDYLAAGSLQVEVWDRMIRTNLRSLYLVTDHVVSRWIEAGTRGRIVNVASTAGQRGEAEHAHYAATKGAMISYTKSLATELIPRGIGVNCVAPGWVETDMNREVFEYGGRARIATTIPLGRIPSPEEIAWPIVFLASDLSAAVVGEIFNVNGGSVLCG